jgi:thioredoxin 1
MKLKVFTLPSCTKCPAAKQVVEEVVKEYKLEYEVVDMNTDDGRLTGLMHHVMSTPSIAIDDEVIVRGEALSKEVLEIEVRKRLRNDVAGSQRVH